MMPGPRHNTGQTGPTKRIIDERTEWRARRNAEGDVVGTREVVVLLLECGHEIDASNRTRVRTSKSARCGTCAPSLLGAPRSRKRKGDRHAGS
jgi:hypothetical protein